MRKSLGISSKVAFFLENIFEAYNKNVDQFCSNFALCNDEQREC